MNPRSLPFWLLMAALYSMPIQARPVEQLSYKYYDITPTSLAGLHKAVFSRSPIKTNGRQYAGQTRWKLSYRYRRTLDGAGCRSGSLAIALDIQYTMPRLAKNHWTPISVRNAFNRYYQALLRHEQGHARSGRLAAREAELALQRLPVFPRCDQLNSAMVSTFNNIVLKYQQRDMEYDRRTVHGKTQGATLTNRR